jgi:amidohydrolase
MDALPVREEGGLPYASANKGVMHACGHDGHTAVLLATAGVLASRRNSFDGNVKFIFQPAEEGGGGGERMVEAGVLTAPDVDAIFALHASPKLSPGQIELSLTPTAGANGFRIEMIGKGAHGSKPHVGVDPIMIGVQIIASAQAVVTREKRPDRPAVLSFCAFNAGTKNNIIPDRAVLLGTIRAMDMKTLRQVRRGLGRVAREVASSLRGKAVVENEEVYPPVNNDPGLVDLVRTVGTELFGRRNVLKPREQSMGAEDFAFFLSDQGGVPGCIFRLGVASDENLHTSRFDFGSEALEPGILMMVNTALRFLAAGNA